MRTDKVVISSAQVTIMSVLGFLALGDGSPLRAERYISVGRMAIGNNYVALARHGGRPNRKKPSILAPQPDGRSARILLNRAGCTALDARTSSFACGAMRSPGSRRSRSLPSSSCPSRRRSPPITSIRDMGSPTTRFRRNTRASSTQMMVWSCLSTTALEYPRSGRLSPARSCVRA